MRLRHLVCLLVLLCACGMRAGAEERGRFEAVDLTASLSPSALAERLADKRVVFVGETHTRYADHLNQLEIIRELHERHPNMAIGVEYLQKRFQPQVDAYIDGTATEQEFLRSTQYFRDWGYDYRLYAPIFRYAREQHIPVRALNVPASLPPAVARVGLEGLSARQRAELPKDMQPAGKAYEARLREEFEAHGERKPGAFERFVEAQLVWDEGMAEAAAAYLEANPARPMVILAGSGHLAFGDGIPKRLARRAHVSFAVVLNSREGIEPGMADFVLLGGDRALPPAGVLGVRLEEKTGEVSVGSLTPGGAAAPSGLEEGEVLLAIDGQPIHAAADVRLELWNKKPGDRVQLTVRRKRVFKTVERKVEVELTAERGQGATTEP